MKQTLSHSLKKHVNSSFRDGIYTNANVGMNESYFVAFMLALSVDEVWAGLSIILAQFLGVLGQMFILPRTQKVTSLRHRLMIFLPLQALAFVPLIAMAVTKLTNPVLMILSLGFYWFNLLSLNPPWWRLMGHTVPKSYRLRFFSYRNLLCQFAVFLGLGFSGLLLYWLKPLGLEKEAFVAIFFLGLLLRILSFLEIKQSHRDYVVKAGEEATLSFREFIQGLRGTEQGKLIIFLFFFYVTVHSSSSYFNPYMLGPLGFNYLQFMAVVAISYFGRVIGSRIFQKKAKPQQMNQILFIVTLGIAINPLLWVVSRNYTWILVIEFISGLNWAGLELATSLLFYQRIQDRDRTSIMSYISFVQVAGMALGCTIGAVFLYFLPSTLDKFLTLFLFSTCFRLFGFVASPQFRYRKDMPELWANIRAPGRWIVNFFDKTK